MRMMTCLTMRMMSEFAVALCVFLVCCCVSARRRQWVTQWVQWRSSRPAARSERPRAKFHPTERHLGRGGSCDGLSAARGVGFTVASVALCFMPCLCLYQAASASRLAALRSTAS
jgi:hypothetical protein